MSEQNQDWEKRMEEIVRKVLKESSPPSSPKEELHKHEEDGGHRTIDEILACPNCYPKIKENVLSKEKQGLLDAVKSDMTKGLIERHKKEFECVNCGTGVDVNESECPTCRGKDAKRRR